MTEMNDEQARQAYLYVSGYLARRSLLQALAAYDEKEYPASQEIRGNWINGLLQLEGFAAPPPGYEGDEPMEGPEDWFGVL